MPSATSKAALWAEAASATACLACISAALRAAPWVPTSVWSCVQGGVQCVAVGPALKTQSRSPSSTLPLVRSMTPPPMGSLSKVHPPSIWPLIGPLSAHIPIQCRTLLPCSGCKCSKSATHLQHFELCVGQLLAECGHLCRHGPMHLSTAFE